MKYLFIAILSTILCACATHKWKPLATAQPKATHSMHLIELVDLFEDLQKMKMMGRQYILANGDTILLSLTDKDQDGIYNESNEIFAISNYDVEYVPILTENAANVSMYHEDLVFAYEEEYFRLKKASADGKDYTFVKINTPAKADARLSLKVDTSLLIEGLDNSGSLTSIASILKNIKAEYIYMLTFGTLPASLVLQRFQRFANCKHVTYISLIYRAPLIVRNVF